MGQTDTFSGWAPTLVTSTEYNAAGQLTKLVRPGGTETRSYNALGQLTVQNGLGRAVQYAYHSTQNDGRITQRIGDGETVNYQYDLLGRLSAAETPGTGLADWGLGFTYL